MHDGTRRRVLALCGGAAASLAGCLADGLADAPGDRTDESETPSSGESITTTGLDSPYHVDVDAVSQAELDERASVLRLDDGVGRRTETHIEDAIDGGYETDDVPDELAAVVAEFEFVTTGGEYFRLDPTFPEYVLTLERVDGETVEDDAVADAQEWRQREGAELLVDAFSAGTVRRVHFPDELVALTEEYEYVTPGERDDAPPDEHFRLSLSVEDPGPPYRLDADPVDAETAYGDVDVYDVEELPDEVRAEVERAVESDGYETDEPPAILDTEYYMASVAVDGTYYRVVVSVA